MRPTWSSAPRACPLELRELGRQLPPARRRTSASRSGTRHNEQEEIYVLVAGSARLKLDDEILELKPWDAVRIHKDTMRNLEGGPDGAEIIAFGAPNTGPGDGQMEQGWWTD